MQAPSSIIYEDNKVMAFLDIRPLNLGHTLVIPRAHCIDIFDIHRVQHVFNIFWRMRNEWHGFILPRRLVLSNELHLIIFVVLLYFH